MGYIMELRKKVGTLPLIMVGACVIIVSPDQKYYFSFEKIMGLGGFRVDQWSPVNHWSK